MRDNLYFDVSGAPPAFLDMTFDQWKQLGRDTGSLWTDPLFPPDSGDAFHLTESSPAAALGFVPFNAALAGVYGSEGWTALAASALYPPMQAAPPPPPAPPMEFSDTFEATPIGAAPSFATLRLDGQGDAISVTAETAFNSQRSLKVLDAPGLSQTYFPHLYYQPAHTQGITTFRFALRADPDALLYHEWRDNASPYLTGPSLAIQNNKLRINNADQMDLPANQWAAFEITCGLGAQSNGQWQLTVTPAGGAPRSFQFPFRNAAWRTLNWLGFVGNDTKSVRFFLDDLELLNQPPAPQP
jgi:hypothetical protein